MDQDIIRGTTCPDDLPGENRVVAGALCILAASMFFSVMGTLVKMAGSSLPNEMVVFFRNFFALIFIMPWLLRQRVDLSTGRPLLHLFRTATGLGAMYCYFHALANMKLAEAVLLSYTSPVFIPLIAFFWLREPVTRKLINAIMIGFIGIVLILKPGASVFQPVGLFGLAAGVLASAAMVSIRKMSSTEPPTRIVFYYTLLCTLASALPLFWAWKTPDARTWGLLVLIGLVAVSAQMVMTKGYSLAPASRLAPFVYATVVFASFFGWIFWGEIFDLPSFAGAFLVCVAGIMATGREKK